MAQYTDGTAGVTNGSAFVTITGGLLVTAGIAAGMPFAVKASGVSYTIASVDSETQITLSAPFVGATDAAALYLIGLDATPSYGLPLPGPHDIDATTLTAEALKKVDAALAALDIRVTALEP